MNVRTLALILLVAVGLAGCTPSGAPSAESGGGSTTNVKVVNNETTPPADKEAPPTDTKESDETMTPASDNLQERMPKDGDEVAVLETGSGKIVILLYPDQAPKTVENFKKLINDKFYDGIVFHRIIQGFMIQGGDPNTKTKGRNTWGTGGPGWTIPDEPSKLKHAPGVLSMANAGPNTGGSQFFLCTSAPRHLDGRHTTFGRVVEGMDVVTKIEGVQTGPGDQPVDTAPVTIKKATIEKWPLE